ncbi:HD family phosphohydrolase [Shouchella lonarensis]|uniref:HD/PDEase domain-containing protein n=1 Tax=Shouchella lonarensis TaxID=1464122 RepID=A0A1G6KJD1_9BACI|nr:HD family phosphohydrolase [Shouchella lonarensis]SDC31222.1 hypothetical protein SAMN05421737_10756 [Shouchella lonarensis]
MTKKKKASAASGWWSKVKHQPYTRAVIFALIGVIMYVMMIDNIIPERLNIALSTPAEQDLHSRVTVEDKQATEKRREEARESIESQMKHKKNYKEERRQHVETIFSVVAKVRDEAKEADKKMSVKDQIKEIRNDFSDSMNTEISDDQLTVLLDTPDQQFELAKDTAVSAVYETMSEQIRVGELQEAKQLAKEQVASVSNLMAGVRETVSGLVDTAITFNVTYDAEATERLRKEAADEVEPVVIRDGELLVKAGDMITHPVYEKLRLVGLLDDAPIIYPYIGLALLVSLIVGMLVYFLNDSQTSVATNHSHLLMFAMVFVMMLLILKGCSYLAPMVDQSGLGYAVPAAAGAMLLSLLIHPKIAIMTSFIFAIIGSVFYNNDSPGTFAFTYGLYILISCLSAIYFLKHTNRATRILRAGFFVACANIVTVLTLLLIKTIHIDWVEFGIHFGAAFLSAFIAAVLTIGILPFIETGFGVLSVSRLIELSNPNHPLLRKILIEAPGTYHHSVVVGNLSEAACEVLGENGLLARVGAYYHDLGKTKRPHFFIENQLKGENPHDKISPQLSKTIIISHPYDGAELLREHKMPKEIIDIAEQHHGTSLLKYFYHKANEESDQPLPESQFRYPGPKPQTKVTSIISIADSVEAAVRSMQKPTPERIEHLVDKIIKDKLEDGQFDESDLTLKELNKIKRSICETLKGTFHQRIEYPEDTLKGDK